MKSSPLIFAHRGDTQQDLENTMPAFASALALGVDGIELDVRLTRDGRIVAFHDDDLQRLAGLSQKIEFSSWDELKKIRLRHPLGEFSIPLLSDVLDLIKDKITLNIEIKTQRHWISPMERPLLELLKEFRLSNSILISSFHPIALLRMKSLAPDLARGYLFEKTSWLQRRMVSWVDPKTLNAPLQYTSQAAVAQAHKDDLRFLVWTVNEEDDMKRCIDFGVDGIITDEPRRLMNLTHDRRPKQSL
jgi:glycerophosphoryl diester phosphodiesterase